jgi:hypothetical protein
VIDSIIKEYKVHLVIGVGQVVIHHFVFKLLLQLSLIFYLLIKLIVLVASHNHCKNDIVFPLEEFDVLGLYLKFLPQ